MAGRSCYVAIPCITKLVLLPVSIAIAVFLMPSPLAAGNSCCKSATLHCMLLPLSTCIAMLILVLALATSQCLLSLTPLNQLLYHNTVNCGVTMLEQLLPLLMASQFITLGAITCCCRKQLLQVHHCPLSMTLSTCIIMLVWLSALCGQFMLIIPDTIALAAVPQHWLSTLCHHDGAASTYGQSIYYS